MPRKMYAKKNEDKIGFFWGGGLLSVQPEDLSDKNSTTFGSQSTICKSLSGPQRTSEKFSMSGPSGAITGIRSLEALQLLLLLL